MVLYISPNTSIGTKHLPIGKIDDNKQIAVHYTNKAIFLLNFTINIILQPKPGSQEMHDNTNTCQNNLQHFAENITKTGKLKNII